MIHETARKAKVGELYTCPRCKGKGFGNWFVQMGTCFKCNGSGVCKKSDPNAVNDMVIYKVKVESGDVHQCNTNDAGNTEVDRELWIGDQVEFSRMKSTVKGVIVGKYRKVSNVKGTILERASKGFNEIRFI